MANTPIGVTFMPSADNQAMGGQNMGTNGPAGNDLTNAFKILSLRLPRVLGASSIAPGKLLNSPGASGVPGQPAGFNPMSAVFQALLKAMAGGGGGFGASSASSSYSPNADMSGQSTFGGGSPSPRAGGSAPDASSAPWTPDSYAAPAAPAWTDSNSANYLTPRFVPGDNVPDPSKFSGGGGY